MSNALNNPKTSFYKKQLNVKEKKKVCSGWNHDDGEEFVRDFR